MNADPAPVSPAATSASATVPRVVAGAPWSGEGKTTVALGLMAALRSRGLRVQGYKVGTDRLDTGYQRHTASPPGRNLDRFMMGESAVCAASAGDAADVAVAEGVMGQFDGHRDGMTPTSTADVMSDAAVLHASGLRVPWVLDLDARLQAAEVLGPAATPRRSRADLLEALEALRQAGSHPEAQC